MVVCYYDSIVGCQSSSLKDKELNRSAKIGAEKESINLHFTIPKRASAVAREIFCANTRARIQSRRALTKKQQHQRSASRTGEDVIDLCDLK